MTVHRSVVYSCVVDGEVYLENCLGVAPAFPEPLTFLFSAGDKRVGWEERREQETCR